MTYYNMTAAKDVATIHIKGQIGDTWLGKGTTSAQFKADLDALGDIKSIELHVDSMGGNMRDGLEIYSLLKNHPAKINVVVDGQASSIAQAIIMAGDTIHMPIGSTQFVHRPLTKVSDVVGNEDVFQELVDDLRAAGDVLIDILVSNNRKGKTREEIMGLLKSEKILNPEESLEWGFADHIESYEIAAINTCDVGDIQKHIELDMASMIKDKKLENYAAQISDRDAKIVLMSERIMELEEAAKPPEVAPATEVIALCKENKLDVVASRLIEEKLPLEQVNYQINNLGRVKDICFAAGIQNLDAVLAASGDNVQMLQTVLNEYAVSMEHDVDNGLPSPTHSDELKGKVPNLGEIYAKRNLN